MDVDGQHVHRRPHPHVRRTAPDRPALSRPAHRGSPQLAGEIPGADGRPGLALSARHELEPGFRTAVLLAEGLFRLDVALSGDTMRTVVRNLSGAPLQMIGPRDGYAEAGVAVGAVDGLEPHATTLHFSLGDGPDRVEVTATLATVRLPGRETVTVTAQAIVRQAAGDPSATPDQG